MSETKQSEPTKQPEQQITKNSPPAPRTRPPLLLSWTSLRGIACISVLICHLSPETPNSWNFSGGVAVAFFLVLSGYLLTMKALEFVWPLKGLHVPQFPDKEYFYRYFVRRLFRIYPTYIVGLLVHDITYHSGGYQDEWPATNWLVLIGKTPHFHFWTVRVELVFYIFIVPILTVLFAYTLRFDHRRWQRKLAEEKMNQQHIHQPMQDQEEERTLKNQTGEQAPEKPFNKPGPWTILGFCALLGVTIFLHIYYGNMGAPDILPTLSKFGWGALGSFFTHYCRLHAKNTTVKKTDPVDDRRQKLIKKLTPIAADTGICLIIIYTYLSNNAISAMYFWDDPTHKPWYFMLSTNAIAFTILLFILERIGTNSLIAKWLQSPFLNYIGEKSYAIYIFHKWIFMIATNEIDLPDFDRNVIAIVLAIIVGVIFTHAVEEQGVRLGEYVTKKGVAWIKKNNKKKAPMMKIHPEIKVHPEPLTKQNTPDTPQTNLHAETPFLHDATHTPFHHNSNLPHQIPLTPSTAFHPELLGHNEAPTTPAVTVRPELCYPEPGVPEVSLAA